MSAPLAVHMRLIYMPMLAKSNHKIPSLDRKSFQQVKVTLHKRHTKDVEVEEVDECFGYG